MATLFTITGQIQSAAVAAGASEGVINFVADGDVIGRGIGIIAVWLPASTIATLTIPGSATLAVSQP